MENYQKVKMWAATVNTDKAIDEILKLKVKYPWIKLEETTKFVLMMSNDLPKIINMITHQEKQNAMHREFIRVSKIADDAIVLAVAEKLNIDLGDKG